MGVSALAPVPPPDVVAARLDALRARIERAGTDPSAVGIVAVTKGFAVEAVDAARAAGLVDIGENHASELLDKWAQSALDPPAPDAGDGALPTRWHYLGAIQRRRVRRLASAVSCWQTVARVAEGESLATHAPGASVFVEVDTTGMPQRNGAPVLSVPALVDDLRALGLVVRGLMTVGPPGAPEEARPAFRAVAALAGEIGLAELSMGMSDDLEVAVTEGSTMVRVGRALFGERPAR